MRFMKIINPTTKWLLMMVHRVGPLKIRPRVIRMNWLKHGPIWAHVRKLPFLGSIECNGSVNIKKTRYFVKINSQGKEI